MRVLILLLLIAYIGINNTFCQDLDFSEAILPLEKEALNELSNNHGPGISISIYYHGNVYNKGFGLADINSKRKINSNTIFMNASTSKVLVALAILKLEQKNELSINDKIGDYIIGLAPEINFLTIKQLLSHTAGLKDRTNDFGKGGDSRQIAFSKDLNAQDIFTMPGIVFSYSNIGYNILGGLIEAITKKDFNSAMKELVFIPLQMKSATYRREEINEKNLAYGHFSSNENYNKQSQFADNARERASGMMYSSAFDFNKFLIWLFNTQKDQELELKQKLLKIIAHKNKTGAYWEYGYGLFHSEYCQQKAIWHTGGIPGFRATFLAIPEKQFSIVVYSNGSNLNRWEIIKKAVQSILNAKCENLQDKESEKLTEFSKPEMKNLVGSYSQGIGAHINIKIVKESLTIRIGNRDYTAMKNREGKLVAIEEGEIKGEYTLFKNEKNDILFLQNWVRAYPKILE